MALSTAAIKPKKKRTAVVLGCDQCRRRKTKCDQGRPTCGPCLYAGLMECTFLLGKTPASKRKKPHSEVEILEARLENIESTYSERLSQMESLLSKVMPTPGGQDPTKDNGEGSSSSATTKQSSRAIKASAEINISMPMDLPSNDDGWTDINSPQDKLGHFDNQWNQGVSSPMIMDPSATPTLSSAKAGTSGMETPHLAFLKEESDNTPLFTPEFQ
ncbi:hypothetical protein BGX27_000404, partial [Mortierella sp. AM989]